VDGDNATRVRETHACPHRVEILLVRKRHVAFLEAPCRRLAQNARRPALLVAFDHPARNVEVTAGDSQGGRV